MIRRPPRSTLSSSSAASDVYKRQVLKGKCIVMDTGWWTWQYCHRKEIRQYHREPDGTRGDDWSCGVFAEVSRDSHHFINGRVCDETASSRSSQVVFKFCDADPSHVGAQHATEMGEQAYVYSIHEPQTCSYTFTICLIQDETEHSTDCATAGPGSTGTSSGNNSAWLPRFDGLIWPNVVAEDSDELHFVHNLKLRV
eukprot:TRINITY_DN18484_c0_g2_i2.p1 TRINITY_DN18484_c0_g2~~TRINITY_DN18484_c0_g2_i2.p1  ORF type:complete len:197 (-),score=27.40 TRINITY_DN18484_c0_g2_i2:543-1133(-)